MSKWNMLKYCQSPLPLALGHGHTVEKMLEAEKEQYFDQRTKATTEESGCFVSRSKPSSSARKMVFAHKV